VTLFYWIQSHAHPVIKQENGSSDISYEAKTGKLDIKDIEYLMLRGYDEITAVRFLVGGFMNDVFKKLPLEYALELNRLIDLEIQGM
jgi:Fe-S cluster assembly protein SufB